MSTLGGDQWLERTWRVHRRTGDMCSSPPTCFTLPHYAAPSPCFEIWYGLSLLSNFLLSVLVWHPPSPSTTPLIFIEANASSVVFLLCGPLMRFCQVNLSDKAGALIRHPSSVPASTFLFSTATSLITGFVATLSQFYAYKLLTLSFC